MSRHGIRSWVMAGLLVGVLAPTAGCASKYWRDRYNDFKDQWELGVTSSDNGQFGIYGGLLHFITLGGTSLDCDLHGLANSQWGSHKYYDKSWATLFVGEDSHVVTSGGVPLPPSEEIMKYDTGFLGLPFGQPGDAQTALTSPFMIHLGYGGIVWNTKFVEVLDFVLGWTTLDIMKDDTGTRPVAEVEEGKGPGTEVPSPGSTQEF